MINDNPKLKNIITFSAAGIILIIILSIIFSFINNHQHKIFITNLDSCTENISSDSRQTLFSQLYPVIVAQNDLKNQSSRKSYDAIIRENSCSTKTFSDYAGTSYQTTAILDIEELQFSYKISFYWTKSDGTAPKNIDLSSVSVACLKDNELIYGDFSCQTNKLTVELPDPIFSVLPYFGDHYSLIITSSDHSTSGYGIILTYDPPEEIYLNGSLDNFKTTVKNSYQEYFENNHINLNDYEIFEKYAIVK